MRMLGAIALAASISLAPGCLSHRERQRVYALEAALDTAGSIRAPVSRHELQLQRVLVPEYLDTTDILLRFGRHEIHESASGRFGERLSLGITHALRSNLATQLPLDSIGLAQPAEKSARQILVTVDGFDVWQDGRCVLSANWSILGADRREVLTAGSGTFTTAAAGGGISNDAAIVAAMANAVHQLADRIASTIQALPP